MLTNARHSQQVQVDADVEDPEGATALTPPRRNGMMACMMQAFRGPQLPGRRQQKSLRTSRGHAKVTWEGEGTSKPLEEDALRSVFLFTDGLANEGIQEGSELVRVEGNSNTAHCTSMSQCLMPRMLCALCQLGSCQHSTNS